VNRNQCTGTTGMARPRPFIIALRAFQPVSEGPGFILSTLCGTNRETNAISLKTVNGDLLCVQWNIRISQ